jgi:hypothetical protein
MLYVKHCDSTYYLKEYSIDVLRYIPNRRLSPKFQEMPPTPPDEFYFKIAVQNNRSYIYAAYRHDGRKFVPVYISDKMLSGKKWRKIDPRFDVEMVQFIRSQFIYGTHGLVGWHLAFNPN